jgi:hypothetical protein
MAEGKTSGDNLRGQLLDGASFPLSAFVFPLKNEFYNCQ